MIAANQIDLENLQKDLSQYHIKLIAYAKQARLELKPNIARLFDALAFSKQVQALYVLKYMDCIKSTRENISSFIRGKNLCDKDAKQETRGKELEIIKKFDIIEEKCRHLYQCSYDALESKKDLNIGNISVCSKCGYVLVGDSPDECLICRSPSGVFRTF